MSVQTEVSLQKLPPQNIEAEQMVLGAVLIENDSMNKIIDLLSPDDFYKDTHRRIFMAMVDMYETGEAIDLVTLADVLRGKVGLEAVGGASYLAFLVSLVPTAANIKNHARIVREKAVLRKLIHTATDIITQSYDDSRTIVNIDELSGPRGEVHLRDRPEKDQGLLRLHEEHRGAQLRDRRTAVRAERDGHRSADRVRRPR